MHQAATAMTSTIPISGPAPELPGLDAAESGLEAA